jgi:4-aminobutyrate aminotransferase-like enzyme
LAQGISTAEANATPVTPDRAGGMIVVGADAARDERLLVAGCGDNRVRLLPPLILSIDEADDFVRLIDATCVAMRTVQVEMA